MSRYASGSHSEGQRCTVASTRERDCDALPLPGIADPAVTPRFLSEQVELAVKATRDGNFDAAINIFEDTLRATNTNPAVAYEPKQMYGQYYTNTKGLQHGLWRWAGDMFEHQKTGAYGKFAILGGGTGW